MAGQIWATNSLGGFMYSDQLSRELRTAVQPACKIRQLCDAKDAAFQGLGHGQTFHWNVYSDLSTTATSSNLTETNTMPEDNFTIAQGTLTISEKGMSVPYTGKLDDLSEHPVKEIIRKVLKNHAVKSIDLSAKVEFDKTPLRVVPTTGTDTAAVTLTTNSVATLTNSIAMGKEHVKSIVDLMKERNIPAYGSGDYYALGWPTTFRTLKNNLESIKQYVESGFAKIMNGEVGRYEGTRFIEQTNAAKGTGTTANAAWSVAKSDWALFMGEDTVAEAIAIPEEIRGKIPTDYGRSRGVAWYALLGFGLVHTSAAQARIVMWDSAA